MTELPQKSKPVALILALSNWLVPGLGYFLAKDYRRGIALFVILNGLFLLGLFAYNGYIYAPPFSPKSPEFNIVALLTLIAQLCHGFGTGLLLYLQSISNGEFSLLIRDPGTAYSDIGSFHLLVVGILNYFSSMKLYDDLTGFIDPELEAKKNKKLEKEQSKDKEKSNKMTEESSTEASI